VTSDTMPPAVPAGPNAVKLYLAALVARAGALPTTHQQIRLTMGDYSETGAARLYRTRQPGPTTLGGVAGEWFIPEGHDPRRRNLYLHGGGWIGGSPSTHRQLVDAIAGVSGRATFAVDYRLAPEHAFPAGLDDCAAALDAIWGNGPEGPGEASSVAVLGDSAGGNLAGAVTVKALMEGARGPSQVVLISPLIDARRPAAAEGVDDPVCTPQGIAAVTAAYLPPGGTADDPLVSPLAAPEAVIARFPPTLIQASADEYLRDMSVAFARRLWNAARPVMLGVWPGQPHVFQLFLPEIAEADQAVRQIGQFLD